MPIDLVIVGCVAVSRDGGRTGKGAGFADLELGLLRQSGLIQADTPIVTTVHALQIVPGAELPMRVYDWSLTWIVTPDEAIATAARRTQPPGLLWEHLRPEQAGDYSSTADPALVLKSFVVRLRVLVGSE